MHVERTSATLRASDADRQRVVDAVHRAVGAGMLTLTEADERMHAAYAAIFRSELAPLTVDLPAQQAPTPRRWRPPAVLLVLPLIAVVLVAVSPMPVHWPIFLLAFLFVRFVLLRGGGRAGFRRTSG